MKYIRKAKNTKAKGRMHDDFITEVVSEEAFTLKHEELGGWELVSNAECDRLCGLAEDQRAAHQEVLQLESDARSAIRKREKEEIKAKEALLNEEFEAFKKWKATQG